MSELEKESMSELARERERGIERERKRKRERESDTRQGGLRPGKVHLIHTNDNIQHLLLLWACATGTNGSPRSPD